MRNDARANVGSGRRGQPSVIPGTRSIHFTLTLDEPLYQRVVEFAEVRRQDRNDFIRAVLRALVRVSDRRAAQRSAPPAAQQDRPSV